MEIIPLYQGKRKNILIISGGGLKGLSGLGALTYLIENEIIVCPEIYAGTSVGSVICFLMNIGYSSQDIYEILLQIDFTQLIKYIEPENLLIDPCFGLSSPEPILQVIYSFMKKKNIKKNITFRELFDLTKTKLVITGTCINDVTINYFSVDKYPNMPILKAIRISISIPFIFRPYLYEGKLWVDGGCMDNFPIDMFADKLDDVIGIYLDDHYESVKDIGEIQDYFYRIFKCFYRGLNYNKIKLYEKYFIHVICTGNHGTNWEISQQDKENLYNLGYDCAKKYIGSKKN
jgi:NTE family protein